MSHNELSSAGREKIRAQIAKLKAETDKLYRETIWYPMVVATGFIAAVATATTLIIKNI